MYGFRVYRKINVMVNGVYAYSTNAFRTCKEAIAALQEKRSVTVAGIPDYTITVKPEDKITAHFEKRQKEGLLCKNSQ